MVRSYQIQFYAMEDSCLVTLPTTSGSAGHAANRRAAALSLIGLILALADSIGDCETQRPFDVLEIITDILGDYDRQEQVRVASLLGSPAADRAAVCTLPLCLPCPGQSQFLLALHLRSPDQRLQSMRCRQEEADAVRLLLPGGPATESAVKAFFFGKNPVVSTADSRDYAAALRSLAHAAATAEAQLQACHRCRCPVMLLQPAAASAAHAVLLRSQWEASIG